MNDHLRHRIEQARARELETLERMVTGGNVHAVLITGIAGSGVHQAATRAAQWFLDPEQTDTRLADRIARGVHPDVLTVRPEGPEILTSQVDEIISRATRKPFEARGQVVIIEDAHTLSGSGSQNATGNRLLKVLEEPPGSMLFVLTAPAPHLILPTVRSRSVHLAFPRLSDVQMTTTLEGTPADANPATTFEQAIRAAQGDPVAGHEILTAGDRWSEIETAATMLDETIQGSRPQHAVTEAALSFLSGMRDRAHSQAEAVFEKERENLPPQDAKRLESKSNPDAHPKRAKKIADRAFMTAAQQLCQDTATLLRDAYAQETGAGEAVLMPQFTDMYGQWAQAASLDFFTYAADAIDEAQARMRLHLSPASVLQSLVVELGLIMSGRVSAQRAYATDAH